MRSNLSRPAEQARKSKRSTNDGNCVEVADNLPGVVAVRDSKDPDGGALVLSRDTFRGLLDFVKGQ
jgi:hypothetical protein